MLRSLIRLYLIVIACVAASIMFIQLSFDRIFYERGAEAARNSLTTYAFVLNDYLERHPGAKRQLALRELALHGNEGFNFVSMAEARAQLTGVPLRDLERGLIAISYNGKDYYMPLADGSVLHARPPEPPDLDIRIYAYLLLALATLFAVVTWVHFHWRDLRKLQAAARAFGAGRLSTRAQLSNKSSIYELSQQFNDMAQRIEASIQQQRDMMHGISHELKTPLARLEFGLALLEAPDDTDRTRERRDALRSDVRELDDLVTELLTIGRLEQGRSELAPMRVAVDELIDSVAGNVTNDVADRGLALDVSTRGAPASHVCDPKLVARAAEPDSQRRALCGEHGVARRDGRRRRHARADRRRRRARHSGRRSRAGIRAATGRRAGSASGWRSCAASRSCMAATCGSRIRRSAARGS